MATTVLSAKPATSGRRCQAVSPKSAGINVCHGACASTHVLDKMPVAHAMHTAKLDEGGDKWRRNRHDHPWSV